MNGLPMNGIADANLQALIFHGQPKNSSGTKVSIKGSKEHGRIEIVFKSEDDMKRIIDMLIPSAEE